MSTKLHHNDQITDAEVTQLLHFATQCLPLDGDFVELGCYKGDTSILLAKLLQTHVSKNVQKRLWIYDSFAGLPAKTSEDSSGVGQNFQAGELAVSKRAVADKIHRAGCTNVIIKKAWFQELKPYDLPPQIAFAFLDGDLYSSIKTSLALVAPLLVPGGIIVVHDYNNPALPGSGRAVDEWLRQNPAYRLQVKHSLAILQSKR